MSIPTYQNRAANESGVVIPFASRRITGVQQRAGSAPAQPGSQEANRLNSQEAALKIFLAAQEGVRNRVAAAFDSMAIRAQLSGNHPTLREVPANPYAN